MQQSFADGLPVICSPSCDAATNSIRNCATQATGGSTDLPKATESYYIPSPTSQLAEISHQAQSQQSASLFPSTINTSIPPYQYPQVNSASSSSQGVWPTPPSTTCEEDVDGYSFHGSPASVPCRAQPYSAHSSEASPGTWSTQEEQHFQMPAYNYPSYPQPQYGQQYFTQASYESQGYPRADMNVDMLVQQEVPATVSGLAEPENQSAAVVGESVRPKQHGTGTAGKKVEEPYAQLIWRAFLSTSTHSMTLQQLYQWFRDNTDKAKNDNPAKGEKDEARGWMNSIRHNLSMNQAFVKRDRKPGPGESVNDTVDAKKVSEWFLEDWAINGVQSTTRYRSKGTSNRQGGPGHRPRTRASVSGRANSGRRGGVAASNSKRNAATRRAMITRNSHGPAFPNTGSSSNLHDPMQTIGYDHRLSLQYSLPNAPRNEQIATPNPGHEGMMLATNPIHSTALPAPEASHGFAFTSTLPHYGQNNQHHHLYSVDDVVGMYQGHHTPIPMHGGPGLATTIPQDLNALFEDNEENRSRLAFSYWNDPTASSQYHS
ncbi:hypothetical protein F4781DRAFT_36126 [Annulohypoxylon bovei var. microspora]|nr:hypothetical protein F4781DRAFT_36126 [Annulohypoxylon bovei var. microspora]